MMQEKERSNGEHEPVECHILLDMRCSRFYVHKSKKQRLACFDPAGARFSKLLLQRSIACIMRTALHCNDTVKVAAVDQSSVHKLTHRLAGRRITLAHPSACSLKFSP